MLPAVVCDSKTLLHKILQLLNVGCWLTEADLYNGCKVVMPCVYSANKKSSDALHKATKQVSL